MCAAVGAGTREPTGNVRRARAAARHAAGACEVLLDRGCSVQLVSRFSALFPGAARTLDSAFDFRRLLEKGLEYRLLSWARSVDADAVCIYNLFSGAETVIPADTVVLAAGSAADGLYFRLSAVHANVHRVGDCVAPLKLDHGIYEGFVAGCDLFGSEERFIGDGDGELESWEPAARAAR